MRVQGVYVALLQGHDGKYSSAGRGRAASAPPDTWGVVAYSYIPTVIVYVCLIPSMVACQKSDSVVPCLKSPSG